MKKFPLRFIMLLILSFSLSFSGLAYLLYLNAVFPELVPFHGGGERATLNSANNYTSQIPWEAYSRLHLTLQTNDTVKLYSNGDYICDCTSYDFIIEPGDYVLILLKSSSPVSGRFTAWQEIPLEKQLLGLSLLLVGLAGIGISTIILKKKYWTHKKGDISTVGRVQISLCA
ncbi:MAG: hypothetical protein GWN64_02810, partial [Candidatus Thorarchaeota archaeon]|nr:hypothetical protein [Candidatus Thorarchaeota archaeon]